ncbi:MAG: hypothetical protein WA857_12705 [Candidatus Acidiferrum sp.]
MTESTRWSRILEGLGIQAIWQLLLFIAASGFVSWGISQLAHAAHAFATAFNIFLVLLGLAGIGRVLGLVPRRTKTYSQNDILENLVICPDPSVPMVYINQHREAIDIPYLVLRNFSETDIDLEPIDVQIVGSSRAFGMTRAQFNPSRVPKQGGRSQMTLAFHNLTAKDVEFIEITCKHPGYFDLNLSGRLRFRASGDSFDAPFGIAVRAGIQRS